MAAVAALAAAWNLTRSTFPEPGPAKRFDIYLPRTELLGSSEGCLLALSPDGRNLVYRVGIGDDAQLLRPMDQLEGRPIPGTEGASDPFFSPDSQWLGFLAGGRLKKVPVAGGEPFTICDCGGLPGNGPSWATDDTILFAAAGLWRVAASEGEPALVATPAPEKGETLYLRATMLPGGRALLFEVRRGGVRGIGVKFLEDEGTVIIAEEGTDPSYVRTGHVLYARGESLHALPLDSERLEVQGPTVPVLRELRVESGGAAQFSFAGNGALVYVPGGGAGGVRRTLVWVDREGNETTLSERQRPFGTDRLSPDGKRIAVNVFDSANPADIWIHTLEDKTWDRLTLAGDNQSPLWTPDGTRVLFASRESRGPPGEYDLFWKASDFTEAREELLDREGGPFPTSWSSAGEELILHEMLSQAERRILVLPMEGDRTPRRFTRESRPFNERSAMVSPNGRWVAYLSDESGQDEIYVRPFPGPGGRRLISNEGGRGPLWGADVGELFYRNGPRMIAATLETGPEFRVVGRKILFENPDYFPSAFAQPTTTIREVSVFSWPGTTAPRTGSTSSSTGSRS